MVRQSVVCNKVKSFNPELIFLRKACEYTSTDGKEWRSSGILRFYQLAANPEDLTSEKLHRVALGAIVSEIMHGIVLAIDDIQDKSQMRRKKACYYLLPGRTINNISEIFAINTVSNLILAAKLKNHVNYQTVIELYNKYFLETEIGQLYDTFFYDEKTKRPIYKMFTSENYQLLSKYKTTRYAIIMPLEIGLSLANKYDANRINDTRDLFYTIGLHFQMQNDYKDFFINQGEVLSKPEMNIGLDIESGRLTWFAIRLLERGSSAQKKQFFENYGKSDKECVLKIVDLYKNLKLDALFQEEENAILRYMQNKIPQIKNGIPQEIYYDLAKKQFRRDIRTL